MEKQESSDEEEPEVIPKFDEYGNELSLFERYDRVVINEPIDDINWIAIKLAVSAISLTLYLAYYKAVFDGPLDMRMWEDLYGRSFFFFLASVPGYLYRSRNN